ncbi:hypothetical protein BHE74_00031371 [Ensete ventricosum]|nr:hypothetical protein BHE74_00031371 [Ensete ventricosum]RZS08677.1 hypothetical protein BHM03_00039681 [Ensete ventricosum]
MQLGTRQECVGSLSGWRKGVRHKKTETRWKIVGGSRKVCREIKLRHRAKDWTMRWELVGRLLGLRRRYREDR